MNLKNIVLGKFLKENIAKELYNLIISNYK